MKTLIFAIILFSAASCNFTRTGAPAERPSGRANTTSATSTSPSVPAGESAVAFGKATPENSAATAECRKTKVGKYVVIADQTFAIDFEPFRGSCFLTSKNPEYDGSPVESEFAIYKNGEKTFDFPQQFNGTGFGCWVEGVAFQDLDKDGLTDIIIVAKCSGKDATYNESSVYVNTGSEFTTDLDANFKLNGLKKISQVADYVKANQKLFFK
jgi:hypothetical protein